MVHHAIKRFGSPPAAIPRRATRRVGSRKMPQAYPPQRGCPLRRRAEAERTKLPLKHASHGRCCLALVAGTHAVYKFFDPR